MKLEFARLIMRDFKEYRGKHVIDFSMLGNGCHYIRGRNTVDALGSNGAGKSTLWDAFMWCLYGRTVRGLRGTDVRTWEGDAHAMSRVDFYCDSDHHFVKRSTEKNGLWLDGKLSSQEEIDRLLGLSIVNVPHTIILGQKQELFFDLKPQAKLEILSETLQLDKWDARSKRAKVLSQDLESERDAKIYAISQAETLIKTQREALERAKLDARSWEQERSKSDSKRETERDKLVKALASATAEQGPFDLAYDSAETELRAARKDLTKKGVERDALVSAIAKEEVKHAKLVIKYDELKALASSDTCPTCGQSIKAHARHASDAKAEIKDVKRRRDLSHDRIIVRETQLAFFDKVITRVRKSIDDFATRSDNAKDGLDRLTARIADIKQQIAVLKAQSREDEVNPHSALVTATRDQIKELKQGIVNKKEDAAKLERRITRTKYWVDGFRQVRLYLLQETLEELQEVTQNLLPSFGLSGWIVEYDIERETKTGSISTGLNVRILKPGMSKSVRWESWSGGEGQRLLIVGAIALSEVLLRRAGIECDLLVLDEPTRHMSKEGVEETVEYLIARGRDAQIFYCDHQVIENNRFASVITVTKDDKGSHIHVNT